MTVWQRPWLFPGRDEKLSQHAPGGFTLFTSQMLTARAHPASVYQCSSSTNHINENSCMKLSVACWDGKGLNSQICGLCYAACFGSTCSHRGNQSNPELFWVITFILWWNCPISRLGTFQRREWSLPGWQRIICSVLLKSCFTKDQESLNKCLHFLCVILHVYHKQTHTVPDWLIFRQTLS